MYLLRSFTVSSLCRFISVSRDPSSVKKTLMYRSRHVLTDIERSKLSLCSLLHHYVVTLLRIVSGRSGPISQERP